jgi:hypothetical protein
MALYTTAQWALPLLSALKPTDKPSILVTSSLLTQVPIPLVFSLSLVKAAQRNLVQSLAMTNPDVHIALLNVGGQVNWEDRCFNPPAVWLSPFKTRRPEWLTADTDCGEVLGAVFPGEGCVDH